MLFLLRGGIADAGALEGVRSKVFTGDRSPAPVWGRGKTADRANHFKRGCLSSHFCADAGADLGSLRHEAAIFWTVEVY